MLKKISVLLFVSSVFIACNNQSSEDKKTTQKDTITVKEVKATLKLEPVKVACVNDTLNAIANIISGLSDTAGPFQYIQTSSDFSVFSKNFNKRWNTFDSSRLITLQGFREQELSKIVKKQSTLFYPFSGPDILYAQTFFPDADRYVMIGLEPVGSYPIFKQEEKDSLDSYFNKINTSLNAILKYSFFRTESMSKDLKNTEVDGTLHLLTLFLKRTGNSLCSAKAITVDSLGTVVYINSFADLKKLKSATKGVEIKFTDKNNNEKTVCYFSLNAANGGLKFNKGFLAYLKNMGTINTYLKGASYLMHKDYFSLIRNVVLEQSEQVVQDDSGIALHYFTDSNFKWDYKFYGQYTKPISLFSHHYQADLDSLYKQQGASAIGFGIGYNFKDKNSNFMIATKQK